MVSALLYSKVSSPGLSPGQGLIAGHLSFTSERTLDSGLSCPGSSPGRGHSCSWETPYPHSASLHPGI